MLSSLLRRAARTILPVVLLASTAAVIPATLASASATSLVTESFTNSTLTTPSAWSLPSGSVGVCLTAGTNTSAAPVPDCQSSGGDPNGSGALQLTNNGGNQVGTIYSNTILPTGNGLDVSWNSYQFNGTGADGISFDLAAVDPSNPAPPATTGPAGGSLGYAALTPPQATTPIPGVPYGYLGFGADVFGNYENSAAGFEGTGCTTNTTSARAPESMGVRGPGNGTTGYCLLAQDNLVSPNRLDNTAAIARSSSVLVPEEVVLNPSASAVTAATSGVSVPAGDWMFATLPIGSAGVWQSLTGPLPTNPTVIPSTWLNSTTGLPQELAFGWASSTGGANEYHQINTLQASTLTAAPVLSLTNTDSGSGTVYTNSSDTVTLTAGVSSSSTVAETQPVTVSDTFPTGLVPGTATSTDAGWTCTTSGQTVSCTHSATSIAAGTNLPSISVPVTAPSSATSLTNTAKVSSSDGAQTTASDSISVVAQSAQTITFTNTPPSPAYVNGTYTVSATGGGSGNPVTFSKDSTSTSGCTVNSSGLVTLSAPAGTCVVDANQAGNSAYSVAAQVQQTVTAVLIPQVITFTSTLTPGMLALSTYTVSATGGDSGNPVVFSIDSTSTSGCTISGSVVSLSAPVGTCVVDANQAGSDAYLPATQATQAATSGYISQSITFTSKPSKKLHPGDTYVVKATGGDSGSPVRFSVDASSSAGCAIKGSTVTLSAPVGTCVVDANQAGSAAYAPATQVAQKVTDTKAPQVVTFTQPNSVPTIVGQSYQLNAKDTSGLSVTFTKGSNSTSGCEVSSTGVVKFLPPTGSCVVHATQRGNSKYAAAPTVTHVFYYSAAVAVHHHSAHLTIFFANASWQLSPAAQASIAKFAVEMRQDHLTYVTVAGFASLTGPSTFNRELGDRRAQVAAVYLLHRLAEINYHGVRVVAVGHGATQFSYAPASAAKNRRATYQAHVVTSQ